jgi:hypothetical protein
LRGQHPVCHVSDEHVLEGQLSLAGRPALAAWREDVLVLQREQGAVEILALGLGQGDQ